MKNLFLLILTCSSLFSSAQVVSGIYTGRLVNDSSKKRQTYELALSEYRGKVTGYSYTTFVSNDTFYYSIKSIKATRDGNILIVRDDKMIVNNFPESPAKGVHQVNYITLNGEDTLRQLNGHWETTKTKVYYALKGGMEMDRNTDSSRSPLISHLKDLNLVGNNRYQNTASSKTKTAALPAPVLTREQRANRLQQTVTVSSDSLVLSFYDNGVIDGDSISVYSNGDPIINNRRLTATAIRKTVYFQSIDELRLQLVAENLGTIPPNTGLLLIKDGEKVLQVNFSADLNTNAEIIIRRKK
jgi:hypothetical protein